MAQQHPNQDQQDRDLEEPGDTNAADIVGRTGEQMPRQSHDGIDGERERGTRTNDEDHTQRTPGSDTSAARHDNSRGGRSSDW